MRRSNLFRYLALTGAFLTWAGTQPALRAQDADDLKRGVARISLMNGDVNVRRGDSGDWVAGVINAPLMTDDRIATGPSSRAEIEFDASNAIRLGANAELRLAQLEYGRYQMELARGLSTFRMLRPGDVNIEIDTPSLSIRPSKQGSVRVLVSESGETEVTARGGDVEIFTPRGSQWIRNGQTMTARGAAADPEFQIVAAGGMDDWDRWSESRDRAVMQSTSVRNVGQGVYGAQDLDAYGSWENVPEYGNVWRPAESADWAPYQNGRWSWVDWYGWTWVSADPWGWAPYHYGRWFHHDRFGWCWYPGVGSARHYWSPALVAFFGFGGGGGVGFGFGNVGWVPLAPYEVYHPWWGRNWYRSGGYFNHQVNITNINITNSYRNSRFRNGISAVGYRDFENGRFNNVGRYNGSQIREAGLIRGATPFTPGSQHLRYTDRSVGVAPRSNDNARFFTHQTPNPAQRVPFNQQIGRQEIGRQGGAGLTTPQPNGLRGQGGQSIQGRDVQGGGWRRFGSTQPGQSSGNQGNTPRVDRGGPGSGSGQIRQDRPAQQQPQQQPRQQAPSRTDQVAPRQDSRGGWQRFGSPGNGGSQPQQQQQRPQSQRQENQVAPRQQFQSSPRNDSNGRQFGSGGGQGRQENIRISPPVVRERPSYNSAPRQSAPSYSAPRQSAPSYSAPRQSAPGRSFGGGGSSAPRNSGGGGGGSRQSSGGGGHSRR